MISAIQCTKLYENESKLSTNRSFKSLKDIHPKYQIKEKNETFKIESQKTKNKYDNAWIEWLKLRHLSTPQTPK